MLVRKTGSYDCPSWLVIVVWVGLSLSAVTFLSPRRSRTYIDDGDISWVESLTLSLEGIVNLMSDSQTTRSYTQSATATLQQDGKDG